MTFAAVGSWIGNSTASITLANQGVGNLIVVDIINYSQSTVWPTAVSGGGVTWTPAGVKFSGTNNNWSAAAFLGKVTATGAGTATITWSGTTPATWGFGGQEFSSTVGSWAFDKQGNLDVLSGSAWPSLTPGFGAGELYFGYAGDLSTAVVGSTSGYTYNANVDTTSNGAAFNPACGASATSPVWGDSGQLFGISILVAETSLSGGKSRRTLAAIKRASLW